MSNDQMAAVMDMTANHVKKAMIEEALKHEPFIAISFLATAPGVEVPPGLVGEMGVMTLHVGYELVTPITQLEFTNAGFSGRFSFNQVGAWCVVPWEAVMIVSLMNADKTPRYQFAFPMLINAVEEAKKPKEEPPKKPRGHLKSI